MIKWTSPTLECTIPTNLDFDYLILTLAQNDIKINKRIEKNEVELGRFNVKFTQEETSQFNPVFNVEAQLNIIKGHTRLATDIVVLNVSKNLYNEAIGNE